MKKRPDLDAVVRKTVGTEMGQGELTLNTKEDKNTEDSTIHKCQ